jgi:hypothetical protein
MKNRPKGISIIAIILFFAAVMALIVGISIVFPGTALDVLWTLNSSFSPGFKFTSAGMILGYFLVILSLVILSAGWGLLKGRKWAWWITIIIFAANGIGDVFRIALGGIIEGIVGILIAVGFLFYLTRPGVKAFFEESREED